MMQKKKKLFIFIFGILCGCFLHAVITPEDKESDTLMLKKNGEQIHLDFSDTANGTKIQFFQNYFVESTKDTITIYQDK